MIYMFSNPHTIKQTILSPPVQVRGAAGWQWRGRGLPPAISGGTAPSSGQTLRSGALPPLRRTSLLSANTTKII